MKSVPIILGVIFLASVYADPATNCDKEANDLKETSLYEEFVRDCIDSSSWTVTGDKESNVWEKCRNQLKFSDNQECLNNNRIYKNSMIPTFDCYYEQLGVLSSSGYNKYRFAKSDALYFNASATKLYKLYSECLNGKAKPSNVEDSVKFYYCVAEEIHEEGSHLMLKNWTPSPNYKEDFEECKKTLSEDLAARFTMNASLNEEFLPYIKCLFGRMGLLEGDCLMLDRVLRVFENNNEVSKCFNTEATEEGFNYVKFWNCLFEKNVFKNLSY